MFQNDLFRPIFHMLLLLQLWNTYSSRSQIKVWKKRVWQEQISLASACETTWFPMHWTTRLLSHLIQEYHFADWETHLAACTNTATCSPPDLPNIKLEWVGSQRLSQSNWAFNQGRLRWTFSARTAWRPTRIAQIYTRTKRNSGDYSFMQAGTNPSLQTLREIGLSVRGVTKMCICRVFCRHQAVKNIPVITSKWLLTL